MEQFTYVKRGYDPEEVDRYIATLEQVIKSYKEKDNAIKNAIISAQVAADNMVKNARAQADEYKGRISKELEKVTEEVARQRVRIQAFQDVYAGMVRKYLTEPDESDVSDLMKRLDDVDKLVERLKEVDITPPPIPTPVDNEPGGMPGWSSRDEINPLQSNAPLPQNPVITHAPPPNQAPAPQISLGPASSPSLNKMPPGGMHPSGYAPPQVVARINDDGNYVPSNS
ncbi:MAG: DivIVA domain-containing protein [Defluviitaleaceae bacterium]|nr:DivIVA domain-containing protein [Defluviitaleaceae bacterium]